MVESPKLELVPNGGLQTDLFGYSEQGKTASLMTTLDQINRKYERGTDRLASEAVRKA
jgi:hypothetical protein